MLVKTHEPGGNEGIEKTVTLVILAGRTTDFSTCLLFGWHSYVSKGFSLQIPPFLSNVTYFLIACIHLLLILTQDIFSQWFFRENGREGKRQKRDINARETHQLVAPRVRNLWACNQGICPWPNSNPWPVSLQANTQPLSKTGEGSNSLLLNLPSDILANNFQTNLTPSYYYTLIIHQVNRPILTLTYFQSMFGMRTG